MLPRKGFTIIELLVVISIIAILSSVILAALGTTHAEARIANGLEFASQVDHTSGDQAVVYYDFNECSGTTLHDDSGNGNTITGFTGPSWSTDTPTKTGCSLYFSGTPIPLPSSSLASFVNSPFTLSLWVKIASYQTAAGFAGSGNWTVGGYFLAENNGGQPGIPAFIVNYSGVQCGAVGTSQLPLNEWVNLVGVDDGSKLYLYQDGQLLSSSGCSSVGANTSPVDLGGSTQGGWGSFTGWLDSVHIYSKSLTP